LTRRESDVERGDELVRIAKQGKRGGKLKGGGKETNGFERALFGQNGGKKGARPFKKRGGDFGPGNAMAKEKDVS